MAEKRERTVNVVDIQDAEGLDDYSAFAHLAPAVQALKSEARALVPRLNGRRVWMVNSTARGGGVAEMLPKMIRLLRDLGVSAEWAVLSTRRANFFELTKRLHNMIHGVAQPPLTPADRELYDAVSRDTARGLRSLDPAPADILVVHDPQPLGAGALLKEELGLRAVWRCHIGLDEESDAARSAWLFLKPYASKYDHCVFTAPEYIPDFLAGGRSSIITPGLDPRGPKNQELPVVKLNGILTDSGLAEARHPAIRSVWKHRTRRLQRGGRLGPSYHPDEIGLGHRPVILQVSRWDTLKGFRPLLEAFARLKSRGPGQKRPAEARHRKRLDLVRLVLAGPEPASIQDDPEARTVLAGLRDDFLKLPRAIQKDVAIVTLPMASRKENALVVNALQRCATIVVQNSLQEGFGLTATEAMWKRAAVLGTRACGLRLQIRDGFEGRLASDPENPDELADLLDRMLAADKLREVWGVRAQRRVYDEFLVFNQLRRWLSLLAELAREPESRHGTDSAP